MFNQLNVRLLIPSIIVGFAFILFILIFGNDMGATGLGVTLFIMLAAQAGVGYVISEQLLTKRINSFKRYVELVVSVEEAPDGPLKDENSDDLGNAINQLSDFIGGLSNIIAEIRDESERLRQGSEFLSTQMTQSVNSVDESANQIEQMADSIEQVASTSAILSESASQVSETTSQVMDILSQGTVSSNTSQRSIESFATEVNALAGDLELLQEESARIGSVLDVIRGIADQTNLLALNAAIEAARAGEQGRGFAVVADEVRALAHRTQESTVEIQSMVEGLQEKSTNAVNAIAKGQSLTTDSLSYSAEVVEALEKIGEVFTEVDNLTSQIATGTEDQQRSTSSINDNMSAVVSLSRELNQGLSSVSEHAEEQQNTAAEVDNTLNKICV